MSAIREFAICALIGIARMVSLLVVLVTLGTVVCEMPKEGSVLAVSMLVWSVSSAFARRE